MFESETSEQCKKRLYRENKSRYQKKQKTKHSDRQQYSNIRRHEL